MRLTKTIGITQSVPGDWTQPSLAWIFSIAIAFLGLSAAVFRPLGGEEWATQNDVCRGLLFWRRIPPRVAGGLLASALAGLSRLRALGGCGLGLGYISPVSTLVKWFPDRPGMATGMAIMGFGGGAFIGSNLSLVFMDTFKSATSTGVAQTFVALGLIYFRLHDLRLVHHPRAG